MNLGFKHRQALKRSWLYQFIKNNVLVCYITVLLILNYSFGCFFFLEVPGPSKQQKTSETGKSKLTNGTAHSDSKSANGKHAQGSSKLTNGKLNAASQLSNGKTDNGKMSIQKDPSASSTYKSLFTSSDKAKNQTKAHWVTYNPFFN